VPRGRSIGNHSERTKANMTESHGCRRWPEGQRRIPITRVLQRVGAVGEGMFVDLILDLRG
jgi:hypothetical protein